MDGTLASILLVLAAGGAGGFVNGVAGGGSLLLFPALLGAGLDPVTANVTNSVSLWPGYASGVAAMRRDLRGTWRTVRPWLVVSCLGAVVGSVALLVLPSTTFELVVPALVAFASVLLLVQPALRRRLTGPTASSAWLLPALGLTGVYGGYFGGVVGVLFLALVSLSGAVSGATVPAVKNLLQLAVNTIALVIFVAAGAVAWAAVAVAAPAALVGGWAGGRTASRAHPEVLRWGVGLFGLLVAVLLLVR